MITLQDSQAFTDLSIIIKLMPKHMQQKIDTNFIDFIEKNKDTNYVSNINPNIPLKYQQLSETTQALLAIIYRDYLCDDEERKQLLITENKEYQKLLDENELKYDFKFKK